MKEKSIKIEFWNFSYLDDYSLWAIRLNVQINVMKFGYQHFPRQELDYLKTMMITMIKYESYQAKYMSQKQGSKEVGV